MLQVPRAVTVPMLAIVLAAGAEECDVDSGTQMACRMDSKITVENQLVVGTSTARCRKRPESHTLTIILDSQDLDGSWKVTGYKDSNVTPRPGRPVTIVARHMCLAALWRLRAVATGRSPDDVPFKFEDTKYREVTKEDCGYG